MLCALGIVFVFCPAFDPLVYEALLRSHLRRTELALAAFLPFQVQAEIFIAAFAMTVIIVILNSMNINIVVTDFY